MELFDLNYLDKKNKYGTIIKEMIIDALLDDLPNQYDREYLLANSEIDYHYLSESGKSYVGLKIKTSNGYKAIRIPNREKEIEISNIIELEFPSTFEYLLKSQGKGWLVVRK